jgi:hypothetical protein
VARDWHHRDRVHNATLQTATLTEQRERLVPPIVNIKANGAASLRDAAAELKRREVPAPRNGDGRQRRLCAYERDGGECARRPWLL